MPLLWNPDTSSLFSVILSLAFCIYLSTYKEKNFSSSREAPEPYLSAAVNSKMGFSSPTRISTRDSTHAREASYH